MPGQLLVSSRRDLVVLVRLLTWHGSNLRLAVETREAFQAEMVPVLAAATISVEEVPFMDLLPDVQVHL